MLKFAEADAPTTRALPEVLPTTMRCACGVQGARAELDEHDSIERIILLARITLQGGIR